MFFIQVAEYTMFSPYGLVTYKLDGQNTQNNRFTLHVHNTYTDYVTLFPLSCIQMIGNGISIMTALPLSYFIFVLV